MNVELLSAYLPMDRRHAAAAGRTLSNRTTGSALVADLGNFTPLAEDLTATLGTRLGAESLTRLLNRVYDALVAQVHDYGGSVVSFSGDGMLCWFDQDSGSRALTCALALQEQIARLDTSELPTGVINLTLKTGVAAGPARRFLVGDPEIHYLDVITGTTIDRAARAEALAGHGEIVASAEVTQELGSQSRTRALSEGFRRVVGVDAKAAPAPWPQLPAAALSPTEVRPYLLPPVYERLVAGQGEFLAELRPAVTLFASLTGMDFDSESGAAQNLDAYVRWIQKILLRYDSYLLQLVTGEKGGYLCAAWGTPTAHEDDAVRAVAAALELCRFPAYLDFAHGVRVGLSQGRVRAGAYGSRVRRTYGVLGDEVNVAARLMEAAPAGELRCSERVCRATAGRWDFEELPKIQLKGKVAGLQVYRPAGLSGPRYTSTPSGLIGRRAEVATAARLLDTTAAGERQILSLEGEAGIGKSRLLIKIEQLARSRGMVWLLGRGQSIEQSTPYRVWRDILGIFFNLDDSMPPADQRAQILERILTVDDSLVERAPLLNDILHLEWPETELTHSFDAKLRHESLTTLIIDLLRTLTAEGPLIIALEDAHWLDSLSWELTLSVARALKSAPLLLILALRPLELAHPTAHRSLTQLPDAVTVELEAMAEKEMITLVAAKLGVTAEALPPEVIELIRDRAGGNPFFAEELAHALRDSEVFEVHDGICALHADPATLRDNVPHTIEGLVLSRIDRLPPDEQLTLKIAAVIGRSFLYRTLHDVYPQRIVEGLLRSHLEDLAARDLTSLEVLEPELTYLFKHIITQQVTYGMLLYAQRRELHRAVAEWYEELDPSEGELSPYYPLLVHHWHHAEDGVRERHYARLAGEQAAAHYAHTEAIAYLSRALELTPESDGADRYALYLAREEAHNMRGDRQAQARDLNALETLALALDDKRRQAEIALRRARYFEKLGDYPAAIAAGGRAVSLGQEAHDLDAEARGHLWQGSTLWKQEHYAAARTALRASLALAREAGLQKVEARSLLNLGNASDYLDSREHYEEALRIFFEMDDRWGIGAAFNNLGVVFYHLGEYAQARTYFEHTLRLFHNMGDRSSETSVLSNLALLCHLSGDNDAALAYGERSVIAARELGDPYHEGCSLTPVGHALTATGRLDEAVEAYEEAFTLQRDLGQHALSMEPLAGLARVSLTRGDLDGALEVTEEILAFILENTLEGTEEPLRVYLTCYRVLEALHDPRAPQILQAAVDLLEIQAAKIADEKMRRSFLEKISCHREIMDAHGSAQRA